jgi:hypothetical protein
MSVTVILKDVSLIISIPSTHNRARCLLIEFKGGVRGNNLILFVSIMFNLDCKLCSCT